MRLRRRVVTAVAIVLLTAGGCTSDHNVFDPEGTKSGRIAALGWFMMATAGVVAIIFYGALFYGLVRGGRTRRLRSEHGFVVAGGIALPLLVIVALSVLTLNVLNDRGGDAEHIEVVGHQFWWEVNYPDAGFTTANEFVIPVGRPVQLTLRSADVIHSFWVPDLAGKVDMVPGRTNELQIDAKEPGEYRGQCAEYCGIQHAKMAFIVRAVPVDEYTTWVQEHSQPAPAPETADQRQGLDAFLRLPCAGCHRIRGTAADGTLGPDLTHLASRSTIAAASVPLDTGHLGGWIANSQTLKPGNLMPPVPLSPDELRDLLAYLESLR